MPTTPPRQFRLSDETLSQIDLIQRKLGLTSRADVIRLAVARLAETEKIRPERGQKKSPEKSD